MASITVLTPDVSQNGLGRADVLARLLAPTHKVTIVGPQYGDGVWAPLRGQAGAPVRAIPMARAGLKGSRAAWEELRQAIDGDLAYVSKPFATLVSAARRAPGGVPVALDIDDWEWGSLRAWRAGMRPRDRALAFARDLRSRHHRTTWNAWAGDHWARSGRRFAFRTVSNAFLQRRFGGSILVHARDTDAFDPALFDPARERQRLGLDGQGTVVMFLGTPRAFKGLEALAGAVRSLPSCTLAIVGADDTPLGRAYQAKLREIGGDSVRFFPPQPFADAARTIAAADIMAIPQSDTPATRAQLPAKLFDAMAMAKPIVASAVSDIPAILEGCGVVVPPDQPVALRAALERLAGDPDLGARLGKAARQACIERYSLPAARRVLLPLVQAAVGDPPRAPATEF
ncbi:MAG: hypothetical protein QOJ26_672 [Thermoplasmata archaeon]|nr:hypothetical protein [Thermoplasmata archaeon]